jgi:hypothetical protein
MIFTETTKEEILEGKEKKVYNRELKNDLLEFLATGYQYARVDDNEGCYNNNNDLRRAIQSCIKLNALPMVVFMFQGITYVERL